MDTIKEQPNRKGPAFSTTNLFFYIFAILVFIAVIYYFSEIKKDLRLLVRVNPPWLALAFAAQLGTYFFNAIIYRSLLRTFGPKALIPIKELLGVSIVTLFINQTVPSVQLSGNIYFYNFLKKKGVPEQGAYSLILLELLGFYTAVLCIILILLFICLFWNGVPAYFNFIFLGGMAAFVFFALLIGFLGRGKTIIQFLKKLSRIRLLKKSIEKFRRIPFANIRNPWHIYSGHPSLVIRTALFHSCIFLLDSLTLFTLFYGLGHPVLFLSASVGIVLAKIISLLPFTPGALILYEGSMTFFLVQLGAPVAVAAMVTLLYRLLSFWLPIPAGLFLYRKLQNSVKVE
jgi:uncharacterized protein (TIRG00374 family)